MASTASNECSTLTTDWSSSKSGQSQKDLKARLVSDVQQKYFSKKQSIYKIWPAWNQAVCLKKMKG